MQLRCVYGYGWNTHRNNVRFLPATAPVYMPLPCINHSYSLLRCQLPAPSSVLAQWENDDVTERWRNDCILCRPIRHWCSCAVRMGEIRIGIMFDFYLRLPHMYAVAPAYIILIVNSTPSSGKTVEGGVKCRKPQQQPVNILYMHCTCTPVAPTTACHTAVFT